MKSQAQNLLEHLQKGETITILGSYLRFGITSLHRRLSDLREQGHVIEGEWKNLPSGKRVKEYRLIQTDEN